MRRIVTPVLLLVVALSGAPTGASDAQAFQQHIEKVREDMTRRRDAAIATRIRLEGKQAKRFQSLVKAFDREWAELGRKSNLLMQEFARVHDRLDAVDTDTIGDRFFELEQDRLALEQKYLHRMNEEINPVAAVQFLQLHRRFELEIRRMTYAPFAE